jgi:hypothetical protein
VPPGGRRGRRQEWCQASPWRRSSRVRLGGCGFLQLALRLITEEKVVALQEVCGALRLGRGGEDRAFVIP